MNNAPRQLDGNWSKHLPVYKIIALVLSFIGVCGIGGFFLAAAALPAVTAGAAGVEATSDLFDDLPKELNIQAPSEQSTMLAADGSKIANFFADNRVVVDSKNISKYMKAAVVSIEDQRFYKHHGIDPEGMIRAILTNLTGGHFSGGSTITQQYVKNVLIEAGVVANDQEAVDSARQRTISRKIREARYALALEKQLTKDQILTGYLNIVPFGVNVYGVEAAARKYFSTSAKDLTIAQAASLAGTTQSPARWDPLLHPEQNEIRRNQVLAKMQEIGYISQKEYDEARHTHVKDTLKPSSTPMGCATAGISAYFCEYVLKTLINSGEWGVNAADRLRQIYRGGLVIQTSLNPQRQQAAFNSLVRRIPVNDPSGISLGLTSLDPRDGHVQAMVQNTNFGSPTKEDPGATQINVNVGIKLGGSGGFQVGSTFKLFTLTQWLLTGHSLYATIDATRREFKASQWHAPCAPNALADYAPYNANHSVHGPMSALYATANSINVAFYDMANRMDDYCGIVKTAEDMGFARSDGKPFHNATSALIGTNESDTLTMAKAYSTVANYGVSCEPQPVLKVSDRNGKVLWEPKPACHRVLSPEVAKQLTYALQGTIRYGTGSTGNFGRPTAGKTGTTDDSTATWFIGYTPQIVTSIWQGHISSPIPMEDVRVNGVYYPVMYGGTLEGPAFRQYMSEALANEPVMQFEAPDNIRHTYDSLYVQAAPSGYSGNHPGVVTVPDDDKDQDDKDAQAKKKDTDKNKKTKDTKKPAKKPTKPSKDAGGHHAKTAPAHPKKP